MQRKRDASARACGSHRRRSPRPPCTNSTAGPLPCSSTQRRAPLISTCGIAATIACAAMAFEHVLVVGAGQMGGGIAQVVAASGRRVSLHDAAPGAVERGLEAMRKSLTKLAEKGGADPDEVLARVAAGRRDRPGRPADRGRRRGLRGEEGDLRARGRGAAGGGDPRVEHVVDPDHVARRGHVARRSRDRHALLQPGAGAEARRGDPRPRDLRRDGARDRRRSRRSSARRRPRRATCRGSSRTGS